MSIVGAIAVPHPPLILPAVGRGEERGISSTVNAYREAAGRVASWKPEVLLITTPHTVMYADYFHISPGLRTAGDMARFRAPEVRVEAEYDVDLRREVIRLAEEEGLQAGTLGERDPELDHGTLIPLWFLREAGVRCPILRIGLSGFSPLEHYRLGRCLQRAVDHLGRRAAVVASGDLSHKLLSSGPYGYAPEGPVYDRLTTEAFARGDFLSLLTMDPTLCDAAAECGARSFQIMAGALDGLGVSPELLSHEGPFGVGYGVAIFTVTGPDGRRCFAEAYLSAEQRRLRDRCAGESAPVRLARQSVETFVRTGRPLEAVPPGLPAFLTDTRAGAFVSLHIREKLRGCIGTILPVRPSLAEEILRNGVSACSEDPRFSPVRVEELSSLEYSVDVLGEPERISSPAELDVKRYGVIVSCGARRGLLLPDLPGVDTVEQQIDIARQKGGIGPGERITLERFEVVRYT